MVLGYWEMFEAPSGCWKIQMKQTLQNQLDESDMVNT